MKKLVLTSTITLAVAVALIFVASVLRSIAFVDFNPATLANAFYTIGYLVAVLSGVIITGCTCVSAVKGTDLKKTILFAVIIAAVGVALVLISAVFGSIAWTGTFNPGTANGLNSALSSIGYLAATLAGVVLVALSVANVVKEEIKK